MVCAPSAVLLEANPGIRSVDDDAAAVGSLPDANPGERVVGNAASTSGIALSSARFGTDGGELALGLSLGTADDGIDPDPLLEAVALDGDRD